VARQSKLEKRDSAGVTIFENTLASPGTFPLAQLSVDTAAVLRIGADSGGDSTSFVHRLAGARVLRSGAIVTGDDFDGRLRFYSRYGALTAFAGGPDSGSGRITSIRGLDARGDTLVVATTGGVALFNSSGKFLTISLPFRGELLGVVPSGRYLVRRTTNETSAFQGQKGVSKTLLMDTLFFADSRGTLAARAAVLPSRIHVNVFNPDPNPLGLTITYLESPFEPESRYATARTGFYYTDSRRLEVRLHSTTGRLTRILRVAVPVTPITSAMVDAWRSAILRKYTVDETRRYIEWILGQYPMPETLPWVRGMKVAGDGKIWLREHSFPAGDVSVWHIFHPDGAYEGIVRIPSRWTVHQIENEFLLASETTPAGNQVVSLHNIRRD
jgi:hypothetical protein